MKHIKTMSLIIALTTVLTACSDTTASNSDSSNNSQNMSDNSMPDSDNSEVNDNTSDEPELIGVCGEVFDTSDFEERPDYVLNTLLYYRKEYGYIALLHDGESYNSYNDPDKFDTEENIKEYERVASDYFIVNTGDNVGDLTCTDAYAEYFLNPAPLGTELPFGLMSSTVCFDGELEVTGYVDYYYDQFKEEGEMRFYPDAESWQGLPVPYEAIYYEYKMSDGGLVYAPFTISLGIADDYSEPDTNSVIQLDSTEHMKLVLTDLQFNFVNSNFGTGPAESGSAKIVSAEKID